MTVLTAKLVMVMLKLFLMKMGLLAQVMEVNLTTHKERLMARLMELVQALKEMVQEMEKDLDQALAMVKEAVKGKD